MVESIHPIVVDYTDQNYATTTRDKIVDDHFIEYCNNKVIWFAIKVNWQKATGSEVLGRIEFAFKYGTGTNRYRCELDIMGGNKFRVQTICESGGGWCTSTTYTYTTGNWYYISIRIQSQLNRIEMKIHETLDMNTNVLSCTSDQTGEYPWNYMDMTIAKEYAAMASGTGLNYLLGPLMSQLLAWTAVPSQINLTRGTLYDEPVPLVFEDSMPFPVVKLFQDAAVWFNRMEDEEAGTDAIQDTVDSIETDVAAVKTDTGNIFTDLGNLITNLAGFGQLLIDIGLMALNLNLKLNTSTFTSGKSDILGDIAVNLAAIVGVGSSLNSLISAINTWANAFDMLGDIVNGTPIAQAIFEALFEQIAINLRSMMETSTVQDKLVAGLQNIISTWVTRSENEGYTAIDAVLADLFNYIFKNLISGVLTDY